MATEYGFVNRTAELEFILTKIDGTNRCNLLGIKKIHYMDKKLARQWYDDLKLQAQQCSKEAHFALDQLFNVMVYKL